MAQQNRTTLKSYFETGDVPTQAQFADLIDSMFNWANDNIDLFSETVNRVFISASQKTQFLAGITGRVRANSESVVSGVNAITFLESFETGTDYFVIFFCYDSNGYDQGGTESSLTDSGFTFTAPDAGTLKYIAIPKQ